MNSSEKLWTPTFSSQQIIAYIDHEFTPPSDAKLANDITEMVDSGFDTVVLPVTETDIASTERQKQLVHIVQALKGADLRVWGDPWGVGGSFGGEGVSPFAQSGELSCWHNPKLMTLYSRWVETTVRAGITTAFLDEPEMKCDEHRGNERPFLQTVTTENKQAGLDNVVVFCADDSKRDQIIEVAGYDTVDQMGTDPYWPNAFDRKLQEADRLQYISDWTDFTLKTAAVAGKPAHIWVQNFAVPETNEYMITEHTTIIRRHLASIAVWAFNGCDSVPDFATLGSVTPTRAWHLTKVALATNK